MSNFLKNIFDVWNTLKQAISERDRVFFGKGEIWYTSLGKNIGDEEDGKNENFERPVLIIRKFNNNIFLALPLTSQNKQGTYYHQLSSGDFSSSVILSQIRLLDAKRLIRFMGKIDHKEISTIKEKVRSIL